MTYLLNHPWYLIGYLVFFPVLILLGFVLWELLVNIYQIIEMIVPHWLNPVPLIILFIIILILML